MDVIKYIKSGLSNVVIEPWVCSSQPSVVIHGLLLFLAHISRSHVCSTSLQHNISYEEMLGGRQLSATLNDDLVTCSTVVFSIVAMEVLALGEPETNLVIPVIAVDSHSGCLVVAALSDYSPVLFFTVWSKLDESGSKWVFEIPDVGRHYLI